LPRWWSSGKSSTTAAKQRKRGSRFSVSTAHCTARVFAVYTYELLKNGAALARKTVEDHEPRFADKESYIAYLEQFQKTLEQPLL
jgi:hypothetical protein